MLLENAEYRFRLLLELLVPRLSLIFPIALFLVGVPLICLVIWRAWRFSVQPSLHSSEPREVPYWIPNLGHAISFIKNQDALFTYGREYFKNTREPFAITLGREKHYILTSYQDVKAAYKNTKTLDIGPVIRKLIGSFGISEPGIESIYAPAPAFTDEIRRLNPQNKSLWALKSDFYHIQLQHPEQLTIVQDKFLTLINDATRFENLPKDINVLWNGEKNHVSLYSLCQQVFVKAGIRAFFGESILEMDSFLLQNFIGFDNHNWMIWYNWPNGSQARDPMAKVLKTIENYLLLPKSERPNAAWLISTMEEAQRQLGMKEKDIAVVLLMFMWVVNTNAYRVAFWALSYIMHSESLYEVIKTETAPAVNADGTIDVQHLVNNCPRIHALWLEILRLANASSAVRTVLEPTKIGGKILKPGYTVMSPFRQLHFDPEVFGPNTGECDPDRFYRNKDLERHPSFKPFGGGVTKCPGRLVARQEVFVFVTLVLHRLKGKLASGIEPQKFPRMELETPTTGIIDPKSGDEVVISIT